MNRQNLRSTASRAAVVGTAAILSGVGSYVLLIIVARQTTGAQYADFAIFWSLTVTIGLGFYFPFEQETAREVAGSVPGNRGGGLGRVVFGSAIGVTAFTALASLLFLTPVGQSYLGSSALLFALMGSFVAYTVQFPTRGFLSGSQRTTAYSSIISIEGVLRVALPLLLMVMGVTGAAPYAWVVAVAALLACLPALLTKDTAWRRHPSVSRSLYLSRLSRLVVAAFSIQLLLNSGTLVAKGLAGADEALAGQILACLSIARIPVFAYQVLQILYLPRLAADWKAGAVSQAAKTVTVAVSLAIGLGVVLVSGMFVLGQWVTGLLFGQDLVLATPGMVMVSAGVGLFIVALVASDGAIAIGRHGLVLRAWLSAILVAIPSIFIAQDTLLRATLPLIVGALVAGIQLLLGIASTLRRARAAQ